MDAARAGAGAAPARAGCPGPRTTAGPAEAGQLAPQSRAAASRETTRYLAAATQVDTKYAANVARRVFGEPLRALAPGYGIDVAVVASWALAALRTRAARDGFLAVVFFLQLLFAALAVMTSPWLLIALPLLLAVAWAAVSWEHWERVHRRIAGHLLRDRFEPGNAPAPRRADERERLEALAARQDGNLVVFSGRSAFVGTGKTAYSRRILFDISYSPGNAARDPENENPADEDPETGAGERSGLEQDFTSHDIHLAIVEAFSTASGLGKSLENISVSERLFVNGRHVRPGSQLLPDPVRPPATRVAGGLLAAAADNPSQDFRSYVCVEMPGWQGQLVVTLFARAVYTGRSLFVEWTFQVLPPLRDMFLQIDDLFEYPRRQQALKSLAAGARATIPALAGSPVTAVSLALRPFAAKARSRRLRYAIRHGYVFDYGAVRSIREDASGGQGRHFLLARDETMYMLLAQQTLLQAVRGFLRDHGVDLENFDRQAQVIFDNSIHIGDITGSTGVAVGTGAAAGVTGTREAGSE
jgi:hypothetical protein